MKNVDTNELTRDEWHELGFFYDYDKRKSCWRFVGSRQGLLRFVEILKSYAANPKNGKISEHDHYGPYSYLKLMTWPEAEITDSAICGTLSDFQTLAESIERKIHSSAVGSIFTVSDEFVADSKNTMQFEVQKDNFDPASADPLLSIAN